jgi:hypothetical protein
MKQLSRNEGVNIANNFSEQELNKITWDAYVASRAIPGPSRSPASM